MRVIAGEFRSRRLKTSAWLGNSPHAGSSARNSVQCLAPDIADAFFMDVYAGTGAVGIEALSRGARRASSSKRTAAPWK